MVTNTAGTKDAVRFVARVEDMGETWLRLERPLPVKVRRPGPRCCGSTFALLRTSTSQVGMCCTTHDVILSTQLATSTVSTLNPNPDHAGLEARGTHVHADAERKHWGAGPHRVIQLDAVPWPLQGGGMYAFRMCAGAQSSIHHCIETVKVAPMADEIHQGHWEGLGYLHGRHAGSRRVKRLFRCRASPQEQGWNGIHLNQVANGWVKDVSIENSDMGVYFWGCVFCSIEGLVLASVPAERGPESGHRGIWLDHGSDSLIRK
jgi:hypothetical protein